MCWCCKIFKKKKEWTRTEENTTCSFEVPTMPLAAAEEWMERMKNADCRLQQKSKSQGRRENRKGNESKLFEDAYSTL